MPRKKQPNDVPLGCGNDLVVLSDEKQIDKKTPEVPIKKKIVKKIVKNIVKKTPEKINSPPQPTPILKTPLNTPLLNTPKRHEECKKVITIPQYTGTCWFNAILMSALFSQYMRGLLLNKKPEMERHNVTEVHAIIWDILQRRFKSTYSMKDYAYMYFQVLTPEVLLKKLHDYDKKTFNFDPLIKSGYFNYLYYPKLLNFLGAQDILMLDMKKDTLYHSIVNGSLKIETAKNSKNKYYKTVQNKVLKIDDKKDYDVILIYNLDLPSSNQVFKKKFVLGETFIHNGKTYVLDSLLLTNFNINYCKKGHDICGITCHGDRYMYNGWIRTTVDRSMVGDKSESNLPCELMKYDWLTTNEDFCINPKLCKLDKVVNNKHDLCFNTHKGERIYVFVNKERSAYKIPLSPTTPDVDLKDIIEEVNKKKEKVPKKVKVPKEKVCPEGKMLNPKTNRCIKDPHYADRVCKDMNISLSNINNSCYLDSIIVALFHGSKNTMKGVFLNADPQEYNPNLTKIALQIKEELNSIYATMISKSSHTDVTYCTHLRGLLQRYQEEYHKTVSKIEKIDWIRAQSEPLDFIKMFNIIFKVPDEVTYKQESWGTNSKGKTLALKSMTKITDTMIRTNFVDVIDIDVLMKGDVKIKDLYPKRITDTVFDADNLWKPNGYDIEFSRRYEKKTYVETPYLHIHVNRLAMDDKLDAQVIPVIKIKSKENLIYIRSIIVHHGSANGGHYTCLYECNGTWFVYDDMKSKTQEIGSFDNLLSYKDGYYLRNCTDMLYW